MSTFFETWIETFKITTGTAGSPAVPGHLREAVVGRAAALAVAPARDLTPQDKVSPHQALTLHLG